ncbi:MAG: succinylglutamate desuccinylase, partial [Marinobacter sp.]|nr:succinylglutamate desuccinylase [Marinobacter sp.]
QPDWLAFTLAHPVTLPEVRSVELSDGASIRLTGTGILHLTPAGAPADSGLIVSAGVHGNETAPIEVLNQLVTELLRGQWVLKRPALLILGNPPAMIAGTRFVDFNLNRLFQGAHLKAPYNGSPEADRAAELEAACRRFAAAVSTLVHYDLHTAIRPSKREKFALYPYVAGRQFPPAGRDFLAASDVHTLLLQHKAGTTFSSFSSTSLGAESLTIELGQVKPFGENDLNRFAGIERSLRELLKGADPTAGRHGEPVTVFEVVEEILNTGADFQFHVPDDVANFTEYPPGTLIWEDRDHAYHVGEEPEAIVFPNRHVPVGQRVGLLVRRQGKH